MNVPRSISAAYGSFSASERLRLTLTLAAAARLDVVEMERLKGSCPKKVDRQIDADYWEGIVSSQRVATTAAMLWLGAESELLEVLAMMAPTVKRGVDVDADKPRPWNLLESAVRLDTPLGRLVVDRVLALKAVHTALERLCSEVGVPPADLLAWHGSLYERMCAGFRCFPTPSAPTRTPSTKWCKS